MAGAALATELLERLAGVRLDGDAGRVISLYLDLDPSRFATAPARASEIGSLLDEAAREIRACDGLTHAARTALGEDLERLRAYFDAEFSADGARGMALFAAAPVGLFEAVPLARPVSTKATLDVAPRLGPLLDERPEASWLVVLVNRARAELLGGWIDRLADLSEWRDDVHGQQAQGGWSQARYERSEDEEAAAHVRRAFERLAKLPWRERYDHVLIATSPELRTDVERDIDATVRERLAAIVELDLLGMAPDAVLGELRPEMEKRERADEEALLERMREGIATGGRAAGGLDDVLFALVEQRVATLLLEPGLERPGVRCHRDGWMASGQGPDAPTTCPIDGTPLESRADIVEDARSAAVRTAADVVTIRWHEDALGPLGGIAALLRF
jgi:peptide chain release factor subunit 1